MASSVAFEWVVVMSPYFQMTVEHVHVFANLALASAAALVVANKYLLAKAVFVVGALVVA